jgi:carboxyl-terminal processing protease
VDAQSQKPNVDLLTKVLAGVAAALFLAVVALGAFFIGRETAPASGSRAATAAPAVSSQYDFSILNDIRQILERDYVRPGNLDDRTLYEAAINGLLNVLGDSGTFYVDPETYKVSVLPSGSFDGIGATIAQQGNEIVIVAPIRNTPAEAAGLRAGDVILEVDGESTAGWTTEKTVLKIRGPRGTQVTIKVRHTDGTIREYTLTRAQINVESVSIVPPATGIRDEAGNEVPGIGYMRIREFTARTPGEIEEAIRELEREGMRGLIIDVRGNPGGLLNATVTVADMFLDSGTIVIQRNRDGREQVFTARSGQAVRGNIPIVVLQNRFSASAAEVLAAALQENGRAVVVGEKSFGKASVNISRELRDGGAVFVSIAQWLTPKGGLLDQSGVIPDVTVVPTDQDVDLRRDPQLYRAVEILKGQIASASR